MNWQHKKYPHAKSFYFNNGRICANFEDVRRKEYFLGDIWVSPDIDKNEPAIMRVRYMKDRFSWESALESFEQIIKQIGD